MCLDCALRLKNGYSNSAILIRLHLFIGLFSGLWQF
jgi:hypothetical protein